MNYSEMVGRYAAKIGWSKKPMGWTTASMIEYGRNHPKWLIQHKNANYIPKRGDIFLLRGHTRVVIEYDEQNDIVTTIEAISYTVNNEKPVNDNGIFRERKPDIHLRGVIKMKFKRTDYHLLGHSPKLCYFYSFAVHYTKK